MAIFGKDDIRWQQLQALRDEQGYDGPLDHDGQKSDPLSPRAQAADALRRRGAGT